MEKKTIIDPSLLEQARSAYQEIELLEKGLGQAMAYRNKFEKDRVLCDYLVKRIRDEIKAKSQWIKEATSQKNTTYLSSIWKTQLEIKKGLCQPNSDKGAPNEGHSDPKKQTWKNLIGKIHEISNAFDHGQALVMKTNKKSSEDEIFLAFVNETVKECERLFSSEESFGKYLDLNEHYQSFKNIKMLHKFKNGSLIGGELEYPKEYLDWIRCFDQLHVQIPLYLKQREVTSNESSMPYLQYLLGLVKYLVTFYKKTRPLEDIKEIEAHFKKTFEEEQKAKNHRMPFKKRVSADEEEGEDKSLYCEACNKTFEKQSVYMSHKQGRRHIKAVNKLAQARATNSEGQEKQEERKVDQVQEHSEAEIKKFNLMAYLESWIIYLRSLLHEEVQQTQNLVYKKQSQSYEEIVASQKQNLKAFAQDEQDNQKVKAPAGGDKQKQSLYVEEDSDDDAEKKINQNLKNLPIGWDGKPIPYWLYRLHGLGVEFKCEICGGASYYGQDAFEKHFQQWRHAYGMKQLNIPNTVHFKGITDIEEALRLNKQIRTVNYNAAFKPDYEEEFEDPEGNVLARKVYIDLKRQELI